MIAVYRAIGDLVADRRHGSYEDQTMVRLEDVAQCLLARAVSQPQRLLLALALRTLETGDDSERADAVRDVRRILASIQRDDALAARPRQSTSSLARARMGPASIGD